MYKYGIICQQQESLGLVILDVTDNAFGEKKGPQEYCPNFYIDTSVSYLHSRDFEDRDCLFIVAFACERDMFSQELTKTGKRAVHVLGKQRIFQGRFPG